MLRSLRGLPVAFVLVACGDKTVTEPSDAGPSYVIADAGTDYKAGFYWLPPMVQQPSHSGTFDADLQPVVEICQLAGDSCAGAPVATYSTSSGPDSETVRIDHESQHYIVNWHTDDFSLASTAVYRITVRAGSDVLLGYADVQPVSTGSQLRNVDTDEYITLMDGRTLPIKFRIETGIVGRVTVSPAAADLRMAESQQFTAQLEDLHGNPITAPMTWSSSDAAVVSVDASGVATAGAVGTATVTAASEGVRGSALVTVSNPADAIIAVSTGFYDTCAIRGDESVVCWGNQGYMAAPELSEVIDVSVGFYHMCAMLRGGDVECWGQNSLSQLEVPAEAEPAAQIAAGWHHTCALNVEGAVVCWGNDAAGQSTVPVDLGTVIGLTAGDQHSCAIRENQTVICWGTGSYNAHVVPEGIGPVADITAGRSHTCALLVGGSVTCWGYPHEGTVHVPEGLSSVVQLDAGWLDTCARTAEGNVVCWGANRNGTNDVPADLPPALDVTMGGVLACAVTNTNDVVCWGEPGYGPPDR